MLSSQKSFKFLLPWFSTGLSTSFFNLLEKYAGYTSLKKKKIPIFRESFLYTPWSVLAFIRIPRNQNFPHYPQSYPQKKAREAGKYREFRQNMWITLKKTKLSTEKNGVPPPLFPQFNSLNLFVKNEDFVTSLS